MRKKHFTLIEIMIVVAIIALLALIALPNFMKAREDAREATCEANLKQIHGAKQQWAISTNQLDTATPALSDLADYFSTSENSIACPAGGTYTIGAVNTEPTCSINGHALP
ncbi:MAG: prepilin-type N-terminal cleavage/methylation domain-containing protein [Lentisphaeria bacterium]|nr:prepilin-type N-terminal cleavage/methylation domain-containing protein [Lentisphaeria bacterium]